MELKEMKWYITQAFEDEGDDNGGEENGAGEKTYTQAELDAAIDKAVKARLARERKKAEGKQSEADRLNELNTEEKLAELQKKIDEMTKKDERAQMTKTARKMLSDASVNVPDEIIENLIGKDADTTKATIEAFAKAYKASVQNAAKAAFSHKGPAASSAAGRSKLTKDEILKIENPIARQQAIRENMDLFRH